MGAVAQVVVVGAAQMDAEFISAQLGTAPLPAEPALGVAITVDGRFHDDPDGG